MVDAGALSKVNNQTWYSRDFSQSYTASIRGVYPGNIVLSTVTDLNLTKIPNTDMPNWKLRAAANCSPIERGFSSNMVTEGLRCGFQEALYHQVVNPQATGFYRYSGEYLCGFHYELVDGLGTLALTDTTGSVVVNSPTMTTCGSTDTVVYTAPNKIIDNSEVLIRISSVSMPSFSRTVSINLRKPTAPVIAVNIFRDVYSYYSINYPTLVIYTLNIPIPLPQYPLDMYWIEVDGLPNIPGYGSNHPLIKELIIMKGIYLADLSIPPVYISYWRKRFGENKIELDLSFPIVDCPEIISFCQNLNFRNCFLRKWFNILIYNLKIRYWLIIISIFISITLTYSILNFDKTGIFIFFHRSSLFLCLLLSSN